MKKAILLLAVVLALIGLQACAPAYANDGSGILSNGNLFIDSAEIDLYIDGELINIGSADSPLIYNSRLYLSVETVGELLGKAYTWDEYTQVLKIGEEREPVIEEYRVGTAEEFLKALGSDRRILLEEGVYNITEAYTNTADKLAPGVHWQAVYDGVELRLDRIKNLTIIGAGKSSSEIVIEPRYAFVLGFYKCENITVENIRAGHTESGQCLGGVFDFDECSGIQLTNTHMYGCGTLGLSLRKVSGMSVSNSSIYKCTLSIMAVRDSENISFTGCEFHNNRDSDLVSIINSESVEFTYCEFLNNVSNNDIFTARASTKLTVENCSFTGNTAKALGNTGASGSNTFENNSFD